MFNHQTSRYRALPTKEVPEEQKDIPPGFHGKENPEMSWRQFFWLFELFEAFCWKHGGRHWKTQAMHRVWNIILDLQVPESSKGGNICAP